MKIVSSRKDDIIKRKAEYEAELADYNEYEEKSRRAMSEAERKIIKPVEDMLIQKLSKFSVLHFNVRVTRGWSRFENDGLEVRVECNENEKFADNSALSWNYNVKVNNEGGIEKESSSWSGLKATTAEQMNSLKQTVEALEVLNSLDWEKIVKVEMPKFDDYYDRNRRKPEREDFEGQLKAAELEDLVGANKAVLIENWGESCPYRGYCYIKILKETPAQYVIETVPGGWRGDYTEEQVRESFSKGSYNQRVKKANINPVTPIKIVDLD